MRRLDTYKIKDWVVLGRTFFKPPFKISDNLINEARIVHVVNGNSTLFAANQHIDVQANDTIIMKSDNFINHWKANPNDEFNEVIVFQLTSQMLREIYNNQLPSWYSTNSKQQVTPVKNIRNHGLTDAFFKSLKYYLDTPEVISEDLLKVKIKELIHILITSDKSQTTQQIFETLFNPNEYQFQEVIQTHIFDDLNLEELSFLTGLSLSSFKRKFKSVYGTSPNKYFISKRLEKAQLLLKTTDLRISEIAYDCGYSDIGYFTKTFQKYYNISPSNFREQLKS